MSAPDFNVAQAQIVRHQIYDLGNDRVRSISCCWIGTPRRRRATGPAPSTSSESWPRPNFPVAGRDLHGARPQRRPRAWRQARRNRSLVDRQRFCARPRGMPGKRRARSFSLLFLINFSSFLHLSLSPCLCPLSHPSVPHPVLLLLLSHFPRSPSHLPTNTFFPLLPPRIPPSVPSSPSRLPPPIKSPT